MRIYQGGGLLPTIVLSELPKNANTSVTNLVEYLAAEVVAAYLPEAFEALEPPVVAEREPGHGDGRLAEHFDLVTSSRGRGWTTWTASAGCGSPGRRACSDTADIAWPGLTRR